MEMFVAKAGTLLLLPNFLYEGQGMDAFSQELRDHIKSLDGCIVEDEKIARAFLRGFDYDKYPSFRELPLYVLNEHIQDIKPLLQLLKEGKTLGLLSDAGLPCLADPGGLLTFHARLQGINIKALSVHSSIMQALMVSGLCQQAFYFIGYMPKESAAFKEKVKKLEKISFYEKTTFIFIETPYRNLAVLNELKDALSPDSYLAYCQDLGSPSEHVYMTACKNFDINAAKVAKKPAVFVFKAK